MAKPVFIFKAYLDGGHDMASVEIGIVASNGTEAIKAFDKAMTQLGFKRSDYGYVSQKGGK